MLSRVEVSKRRGGGFPSFINGREQLRERVRKGFDSLVLQFLSYNVHRNAERFELGDPLTRFVETACEGDLDPAMILEGFECLRRDGVDRFGTDEVVHVDRVRVGGILGAGACPQRTLNARAFDLEILPAAADESVLKNLIGKFCICNRGLTAQG